ncbi:MAG: hypothetical protein ACE5E6_01245 [Phycisphaerae bacterium]
MFRLGTYSMALVTLGLAQWDVHGVVLGQAPGATTTDGAVAASVVVGTSASAPVGGPAKLPAAFTLGRYVPADMWLYMHFVDNDECAWLDAEWDEVFDAFKASGIGEDILGFIVSKLPADRRASAQATIDTVQQLIGEVGWGDLFGLEFVFAERIGPPFPDYVVLGRGPKGSGARNAAALAALLERAASLSEAMSTSRETIRGADVLRFVWRLRKGDGAGPAFLVTLVRKDDVVGVVVGMAGGRDTTREILGLMAGVGRGGAIVDLPKFRQALSQVPTAEDGVLFFDYRSLLAGVASMVHVEAQRHGPSEGDTPWEKVLQGTIDLWDVAEYGIVTIETQGRRQLTHTVNRLQPGKVGVPMARVFIDRKPFERFDEYIPVDALGFSIDGFIDLELLYHTIRDFVETDVPGGADVLGRIDGWLAGAGFNPDEDLFSWWSGEMISVSLPAEMVSPMGGSDSVLMVRVKDRALAAKKLAAALDWVQGKMRHMGPLMVQRSTIGDGAFFEVTHPMLAMLMRPVVGVSGDWLIVGSSGDAVRKCLAVAAGEAPSIRQNKRFSAEGLIPEGPVMSASYTDTSNLGNELASVVAGIGWGGNMVMGFAAAGAAGDPQAQAGMADVQKIFSIVGKLGPVLQQLDFFSSEAKVTTRNGPTVRTEEVITYKPPKPSKATAQR